jgi:hypothetical protein
MNRYVAVFSIPARVIDEWVKNTPPEKRQSMGNEMMGEWQKWMDAHAKSIADKGTPLGKTKRVTAKGVSDTRNDMNFYIIVDAENHAAAAKMFQGHPHLQIPEASIEVMEVPHPPGM